MRVLVLSALCLFSASALAEVGIGRRDHAYWAGRATLVHRPEDVPTYDRVFGVIFDGTATDELAPDPVDVEHVTLLTDSDDAPLA